MRIIYSRIIETNEYCCINTHYTVLLAVGVLVWIHVYWYVTTLCLAILFLLLLLLRLTLCHFLLMIIAVKMTGLIELVRLHTRYQ